MSETTYTRAEAIRNIGEDLDYLRRYGLTEAHMSAQYAKAIGHDYAEQIVRLGVERKMEALEIEVTGQDLHFKVRYMM